MIYPFSELTHGLFCCSVWTHSTCVCCVFHLTPGLRAEIVSVDAIVQRRWTDSWREAHVNYHWTGRRNGETHHSSDHTVKYTPNCFHRWIYCIKLRSATRGDLVVSSSVMHFGTCAFAVAGPKAWNQLPMHIWAQETVSSFKTALKTQLHSVD